jgi:hypothetical protein
VRSPARQVPEPEAIVDITRAPPGPGQAEAWRRLWARLLGPATPSSTPPSSETESDEVTPSSEPSGGTLRGGEITRR